MKTITITIEEYDKLKADVKAADITIQLLLAHLRHTGLCLANSAKKLDGLYQNVANDAFDAMRKIAK
jgi:hypothetical protein